MRRVQPTTSKQEVATLGSGCFWCSEAIFSELEGVLNVEPGYSGGAVKDPTYEQVCSGRTGHIEVVRLTFDPGVISYREILQVFFSTHDPTTMDRQGADVGRQYRSIIFCHDSTQRSVAEALIRELTNDKVFPSPIVTEVASATTFYPAEDYHRNYLLRNPYQPYCRMVVAPKLAKFRAHFQTKLKKQVPSAKQG